MLSDKEIMVGLSFNYSVAWGDQFRLDQVIVVLDSCGICPATARRTAGTEAGNAVIVTAVRAESIGRSYRDCGRLVSGTMNLAINFLASRVLAIVAGSGNNDDTSINQATDCPAYRIILVGINCRRAQTQVDHANVVRSVIGQQPIQGAQRAGNRTQT